HAVLRQAELMLQMTNMHSFCADCGSKNTPTFTKVVIVVIDQTHHTFIFSLTTINRVITRVLAAKILRINLGIFSFACSKEPRHFFYIPPLRHLPKPRHTTFLIFFVSWIGHAAMPPSILIMSCSSFL